MVSSACRWAGQASRHLREPAGLLLAAAIVLICAPAEAIVGGPDAATGYTWLDEEEAGGPSYDYQFGTQERELADDGVVTIDIGFAFTLFGQEYTQVDVHGNGALSLGASFPIGHDHDCAQIVPDSQDGDVPLDVPVIMPYWVDLDPSAVADNGGIYTGTSGVSPDRMLVVEWYQVPHYGVGGDATFEVKLFEADGAIEFHFSDLDVDGTGSDNGAASAIGISSSAGHYFAVSCDSGAIVGDGAAVRFEPPGCPDEDGDGVAGCEGDCDDGDPDRYPGAPEQCNGVDDDCDGSVPSGEDDIDGDSWRGCEGDCNDNDETLNLDDADGDGEDTCEGDCDDSDPDRNSLDDDGDGQSGCDGDCDDTDPDVDGADADEDGFSTCDGDCDDDEGLVRPGASELCDGLDNDCDGDIDENPNCGGDDDDDELPPGWAIPYGCILDCAHAGAGSNGVGLALPCLLAAGCVLRRRRGNQR